MSWIKDVVHELKGLDFSTKSLRKFGIVIGIIFLAITILFIWNNSFWRGIFLAIGGVLFLNGLFKPSNLKFAYKFWMTIAFALGWVVSRFILIILFIFILTPIGFIAKTFGKHFLDLKFKDDKESYWIKKETKKIDYEKMY